MSIELIAKHPKQTDLWQWEQGRRVSIAVECDQISFSFEHDSHAIVGVIEEEMGCRSAEIPNALLMENKKIRVWVEKDGAVIAHKMFQVKRRARPDTYVYVPTKVVTIEDIKDDIKKELMLYVDERVDEVVEEKLVEVNPPTASVESIAALFSKGGES